MSATKQELEFTPVEDIPGIVDSVREAFLSDFTKSYEWRRNQLLGIQKCINENENAFVEAVQNDLHRPKTECIIGEVDVVRAEVDNALYNLKDWMKPEKVTTPLGQLPGSAEIIREPLGVVCIIGPWNFPIQLLVCPLVAALAAGNACVMKPSELAPYCAKLLEELIPRYVDTDAVAFVQGAVKETTELLKQRFDHVFYTGNPAVGKIVMKAASENLTPVTLELGGKSPTIVDETSNLDVAAKRIISGRMLNAGQACISPEYILVHQSVRQKLIETLKQTIIDFYGNDAESIKNCPDLARIINSRHFTRVKKLLDDKKVKDKIVFGGETDASQNYVQPTLIYDAGNDSDIMNQEVFGPILVIQEYSTLQEVVNAVRSREKPLALYIFSSNQKTIDYILSRTSSGGVCINDTVMQFCNPNLPFGGVGESGTGAYHGKWGFEELSHRRSVCTKPTWVDPPIRYPPYTERNTRLIHNVLTTQRLPAAFLWRPLLKLAKYGLFALAVYLATVHFREQ
eukprot:gb/GECG01013254.1/.p1 GENE.gb/GECG01013254.1/~~gb/GECG01013254.1/.p1  ORF type:complete len:513 (+),score=67.65 gb/GECG01013254.1/:1-1539(+)